MQKPSKRKFALYGLAVVIVAGLLYFILSLSPCIEPVFGNTTINFEAMERLLYAEPEMISIAIDYELTRRDAFGALWLRIYNNSSTHYINVFRDGGQLYARDADVWRVLTERRSIIVYSGWGRSPFHSEPIAPEGFAHYAFRFRYHFGRICGHDFMLLQRWSVDLLHATGHPIRMYEQSTVIGFVTN